MCHCWHYRHYTTIGDVSVFDDLQRMQQHGHRRMFIRQCLWGLVPRPMTAWAPSVKWCCVCLMSREPGPGWSGDPRQGVTAPDVLFPTGRESALDEPKCLPSRNASSLSYCVWENKKKGCECWVRLTPESLWWGGPAVLVYIHMPVRAWWPAEHVPRHLRMYYHVRMCITHTCVWRLRLYHVDVSYICMLFCMWPVPHMVMSLCDGVTG